MSFYFYETKKLEDLMKNRGFSSTVKNRIKYDGFLFTIHYNVGGNNSFNLNHFSVGVNNLDDIFDFFFNPDDTTLTKVTIKKLLDKDDPDKIASFLIKKIQVKDYPKLIARIIELSQKEGEENFKEKLRNLILM